MLFYLNCKFSSALAPLLSPLPKCNVVVPGNIKGMFINYSVIFNTLDLYLYVILRRALVTRLKMLPF